MNPDGVPPRWLIRRQRPGKWAVALRIFDSHTGYFYLPFRTLNTGKDAIAYVNRVETNNYGRAAA